MDEISLLSERIERATLADLHKAAPEETRNLLGLSLKTIGNAMVSIAKNDPTILINRTIGLGVASPATKDDVNTIVRCYASDDVGHYFLHLHPDAQPPELRNWIEEAGLRKHRSWMKFSRGIEAPPDFKSELKSKTNRERTCYGFRKNRSSGVRHDRGCSAIDCSPCREA